MSEPGRKLGLIAGSGRFPLELARAATRQGHAVLGVALHGLTDAALEDQVEELRWLHIGQLGALIETLHQARIHEVVMAGKVPKTRLFEDPAALRLDARALELLSGLRDKRDDALLAGIAELLAGEGIRVLPQAEWVPELRAPEGPLASLSPTPEQWADIAFAWPIAKQVGRLDIGQTVVVRDRAVLAVEAIEGTDQAILRGGRLGGGGVCVVKVMKPGQDPRFDLPAVGTDTIAALVEAKAAVLAVEADHTLLLDREQLVQQADAYGICLLGVPASGPEPEATS